MPPKKQLLSTGADESTSRYFKSEISSRKKPVRKLSAVTHDESEGEMHTENEVKAKKPRKKLTIEVTDGPIDQENKITKWEPPHWTEHWKNILQMRIINKHLEPKGCDTIGETITNDKIRRFHVLVSLMLSSQTKDTITIPAMDRLRDAGLTIQYILDISDDELGRIIYPVGFWRRKVQYLKETCKILHKKYDDDIPDTLEGLCSLPGVGPKMAYLTMDFAWKNNVGIGVDVHVHRIVNRLQWVEKPTKTPEQTRLALESWIPRYDYIDPIS
ncbi:unnamed protein product [Didymodactylos carnosus]|uniref:DNA-(apurinic or apyrimidinic site) lyase n=1 Tax=Didymodactylos carnosus TaxID=1234261 RepID=A0A815RTY1_9BILA|nr:unnamed protein product [Didymodactylos carnosus]CAF1481799.1 unnamed protein product [Didymodactylos carnosus]CAF4177654.1 unnamed protein product [Didymodactylos carnosus]CAF4346714.1 unnamed protein product [Didymodactylos carnosus]